MFGLSPLVPAYGRDYTSQKAVLEDFNANKDFKTPMGQFTNKSDIQRVNPEIKTIEIRYARLTKLIIAKL